MNVEIFAEWLRRQGHRVIRTKSSYWYDAGPRVLQAFPYHWVIQPSEQELRRLMLRHNILALRYSTSLKSAEGMISYHIVLKPPYSMDVLKSNVRNRLRKGLRECQVEKIPFRKLADEGWQLQKHTLERQGRLSNTSQAEWKRICLSAEDLEGFEAWGAFVNGQLAASILTCRIEDIYYIPFAQSLRKYYKLYVNNALFYTASGDMLARENVSGVFGNLHSLDAPESVSRFKIHLGFTARPVRQRIVFHPLLTPLANSVTHGIVVYLQKRNPANNTLSKAEGMLRFYVHGRSPLANQDWPDCLSQYKQELHG